MQTDEQRDRRRLYLWGGVVAGLVLVVAATRAADFIPGDVNHDGTFDMADSTVLRRDLAGLEPGISQTCAAEPPVTGGGSGPCGGAAPVSVLVDGVTSGPWSGACGGAVIVQASPCPDRRNCTFSGQADDLLLGRALNSAPETQLVAHRFRLESDLAQLPTNVRSVSIAPLRFQFTPDGSQANPWQRFIPIAQDRLGLTITATIPGELPTASSGWWFAVLNGSEGRESRDFAVVPTLSDGSDAPGVRFGGTTCLPTHWSVAAESRDVLTETLVIECGGVQVSGTEPLLGALLSEMILGSAQERSVTVTYPGRTSAGVVDYLGVEISSYVFPQFDRSRVNVLLEEAFSLQVDRVNVAP